MNSRISLGKTGEPRDRARLLPIRGNGLSRVLLIALLVAIWLVPSSMVDAAQADRRHVIAIPSQDLLGALTSLAQQTEHQLLFPYDLVKARRSEPLQGEFTIEEALGRLLRGTGLSGKLTERGVIIVSASENEPNPGDNQMSKRNRIAAAIISALFGAQAVAQQTPGLEEVIVTAQKKSQNVLDVPIAIAVTTGEQIQEASLDDVLDIQLRTPGLVATTLTGYAQLYIRGVGTTTSNPGLEPSVATYVDDVYVPQQIGSIYDLLDMGAVEVLKGPQGSLYGRNATGGAMLMHTAAPTAENEGYLKAEFGRFDRVSAEGVVNAPLSDALRVRLAGRHEEDDGYIENISSGKNVQDFKNDKIRAKIAFAPSDSVNVLLTTEYGKRKEGLNVGKVITPAPQCLPCAIFGTAITKRGTYKTNIDQLPPVETTQSFVGLQGTFELGDSWDLKSITGYRKQEWDGQIDIDSIVTEFQHFAANIESKFWSQEFQLTSKFDGKVNYLVGASYSDQDGAWNKTNIHGLAFAPFTGIDTRNDIGVKATSVYAEVYVDFADGWKLTLGGRYSKDKKDVSGHNDPTATIFFGTSTFDVNESFDDFTPRVVLTRDLDNGIAYLSYNRGFKSGGFNTPAFSAPAVIDSEKIDAYELGAKLEFLDRRLITNMALFYYDHKNLQVNYADVSTGGQRIENAAATKTIGAELGAELRLSDDWSIGGEVAYLDAEYNDYPHADVLTPGALGFVHILGGEDLKNFTLTRAPKISGSAFARYETTLDNGAQLRMALTGKYTDKFYFFPGGGGTLRLDQQKAYFLANFTGSLLLTNQVELGVYVDNITDKYYVVDRETRDMGTFEIPAKPRTWGVSLKYNW